MTAAYTGNVSTPGGVLHLAFELGWTHWKLAFTIGYGQKPRQRTIGARDLAALDQEIAKAKKRFQLADAALVVSCYEAGRDGFWLHRYLTARGIVKDGRTEGRGRKGTVSTNPRSNLRYGKIWFWRIRNHLRYG